MTVATLGYAGFAPQSGGNGWREGLANVSSCLHELANDEHYELPGWFRSACDRTSVYILDPIVDLSYGRFPSTWKGSWLMQFVDRWHQENEFEPAPYGWTALKTWLRFRRTALGNFNSIILRQK